ncbi:MAG: hypothetical protein IJJ33_07135 [Victivallales bacterium]|nr:hypothetical protein [Victivallales bacterium]
MKTLRIMLDFGNGPIWQDCTDPVTLESHTGIPVVDNDARIWELNDEIQKIFLSYYEFDSHNQACWFNDAQEKADKEKMLALLRKLLDRLDEINDGSFVVDDQETPRLQAL